MIHILTDIKKPDLDAILYKEWLVTNGLGGFACGNISNILMRRYHALLISALHFPLGRTIMLNHVADSIVFSDKKEVMLTHQRRSRDDEVPPLYLTEFKLKDGVPFWIYEINGIVIEKRLHVVNRQNTVHINYKLISGNEPIHLRWRPFLHFRNYEMPVNAKIQKEVYSIHSQNNHYEIECEPYPPLRMSNNAQASFTLDFKKEDNIYYQMEDDRGYESVGDLTSPGYFSIEMKVGDSITFIASTESWETIEAIDAEEAWRAESLRRRNLLKTAGIIANSLTHTVQNETVGKLVLAADQFIFRPTTRFADMVRLQAAGGEPGSIIAGYPWFTDWGRDTMISLEGLTLVTGRYELAYSILRTFGYYVKDGLIPNMFPDRENFARYNTADASLWFFHATDRYIQITQDKYILELLMPKFTEIIHHHLNGTHFGIKVDEDGLLTQGEPTLQLTWMDAKVGDWVVTPRRGKAVEINALWYNALRLMHEWTGKYADHASRAYESFNKRFWYEKGGYLYDVVDDLDPNKARDDSALRSNQIFAISFKYPVLDPSRWEKVVEIVRSQLLTPFGLRTLAPSHPDFRACYSGDLRSRDAAYHQGTVWPWLLGPFIDAWLKVYPDDYVNPQFFLQGLEEHLNHTCVGNIAEIFDATEPYCARGCFAQAWSVAEVLRCLVKVTSARR